MGNFKTLHTARLMLRPIELSDAELIFTIRRDAQMNRYVHIQPPKDMAEAQAHVERLIKGTKDNFSDFWIMTLNASQEIVGTITLWNYNHSKRQAEIGFGLLPAYWGHGYMSEAIQTVIAFGKEQLAFLRIEGWTHKENLAAQKVLQSGGLVRDPEAEKQIDPEGPEKDFQVWAIHW